MNHDRKEQRAVALTYHRDVPAPFVLAKGKGRLADRIQDLARRYNIPLVSDAELADSLYILEVGETIPEELYQIVAELFAFVYRVTQDREDE
jgi:flagellar biosynthesis protein